MNPIILRKQGKKCVHKGNEHHYLKKPGKKGVHKGDESHYLEEPRKKLRSKRG
jgi:hypothetical protein